MRFILMMVLIIFFGLQSFVAQKISLHFSPNDLLACGGCVRFELLNKEYFRFFTAAFLHGGLYHLLCNLWALCFAGYYLEPLIGWRWFLAVYMFTALSGSFLSSLFLNSHTVSIGASTAICGLFGTILLLSFRFHTNSILRKNLVNTALWSLVPTLAQPFGVDHFGHIGGALGGVIIGGFLFNIWQKNHLRPLFENRALIFGIICILYTLYGFSETMLKHFSRT